ncbi:hypothetical protein [Acinetobacter sp. IK40]|uniref:hypothetical protein n=1 Tax=Acinetobacter sp. IK40 TaxID=2928897 RepID=UPI002D1F8D85|nr:hypothetical protein [Acinetobacter sp. IK40]MEB3790127.1 hypothetical protein [Acinetobacter sp. IK40]
MDSKDIKAGVNALASKKAELKETIEQFIMCECAKFEVETGFSVADIRIDFNFGNYTKARIRLYTGLD